MNLGVSVALCTHNGARFIEEQLRSILRQTVLPKQIVVSDDASTDGTLGVIVRVIDSLAADDPARSVRVDILENQTALGVVPNFEQAMLACTEPLIALCDQDDVWYPQRLSAAIDLFGRSPDVMLVHSDARLIDDGGRPLGYSLFDALGVTAAERAEAAAGDELAVLLRRNLVTGATAMVRSSVVAAAVPIPGALWIHDEWLAVIAASIGDGALVDVEQVDYRQHANNQIGVKRLGLRGKVGRILEPRNGRNVYLLNRTSVLVDRLEALGDRVRPDALARVTEKRAHLAVRAKLSRNRLARLVPVLREASTGRYRLYSRGVGDILRDLLQPAGDEPR